MKARRRSTTKKALQEFMQSLNKETEEQEVAHTINRVGSVTQRSVAVITEHEDEFRTQVLQHDIVERQLQAKFVEARK